MINSKKIGSLIEISSSTGFIHKLGTDLYCKTKILLKGESVSDYEEVDELPKYTYEEYKQKVIELIRKRYSADDEFALINNIMDVNSTQRQKSEYAEYQAYREECKIKAKEELCE